MIVNDFYPTPSGNDKTSIMGMSFTAELQSIPVTDPEFTQAYWLGWMRWDNLPLQYHVSRATFENGTLTFTDITKVENVPVGFSIHNKTYYDVYQFGASEEKYNGTKWAAADYVYSSDAPTNFYLPNSLDINVLSWGRLRLIYLAMSVDRTIVLESIVSDVPYADFAAGNDMTAEVLDGGSFRNQTFTVTKEDISNHAIFQKEINGTVFDIVLASYTVPYNRDCRFDNNVDDYAAVHPMVKVHTTEDTPYVSGITNPIQYQFKDDCSWSGSYLGQGFFSNWSGMVDRLSSSRITDQIWDRFGGFIGSFKVSDLAPFAIDLFVPEGATFYVRGIGRNDINIIGRVLTYDEILHCLSLLPRMQDTTTNLYEQNASYWYGHVDIETNEFLGDLVNGSQLNKLVDWQLLNHNIVDNDFKEDEIPDYRPPGPLPVGTEDKFTGDNTVGDITRTLPYGGVQFFALNGNELGNFRDVLWSQPKSFYTALQITGLYRSSIFDYITSLRLFPIAANLTRTGSNKEKIYMGTGAIFKDNNGNDLEYYPGDQLKSFKCGTWDLNDATFHWRNNYLDYAPYTKISIYLPYVGTCDLDPASIAAFGPISQAQLELVIFIDALTGSATYYLYTYSGGNQLLLQKTFKMGIELPLSGNDSAQQSANMLRAQFNTSKAVLGGVLSPMSAFASGNVTGGVAGVANLGATIGNAYLENSLAKKQVPVEVQGVGGVYSNLAWGQVPYITVHRQKYSNPENYGHTTGYLVDGTYTINRLSGFTICRNVDASGISKAIDKEKAEIKKILESGFYA